MTVHFETDFYNLMNFDSLDDEWDFSAKYLYECEQQFIQKLKSTDCCEDDDDREALDTLIQLVADSRYTIERIDEAGIIRITVPLFETLGVIDENGMFI